MGRNYERDSEKEEKYSLNMSQGEFCFLVNVDYTEVKYNILFQLEIYFIFCSLFFLPDLQASQ